MAYDFFLEYVYLSPTRKKILRGTGFKGDYKLCTVKRLVTTNHVFFPVVYLNNRV